MQYLFKLWIILLLALLAIFLLYNLLSKDVDMNKRDSFEYEYYNGLVKINRYLFEINSQCRNGQTDVAHNTFLELKQHWQRLDAIVLAKQNPGLLKVYFPSDSLVNLEKYLNKLKIYEAEDTAIFSVLTEIKRINERVDQIEKPE